MKKALDPDHGDGPPRLSPSLRWRSRAASASFAGVHDASNAVLILITLLHHRAAWAAFSQQASASTVSWQAEWNANGRHDLRVRAVLAH